MVLFGGSVRIVARPNLRMVYARSVILCSGSDREKVEKLFTDTVNGLPLHAILQSDFPLITKAPEALPLLEAGDDK